MKNQKRNPSFGAGSCVYLNERVKTMKSTINSAALTAARDDQERENLIREYERVILRTASRAVRRFVTKSDDEWSVALYAFSRAIDTYSTDRGDFLPYAQMLIKRALIDEHRKRERIPETPVSPYVMEGNGEPEEDTEGAYRQIARNSMAASNTDLKDEILAANELLTEYGFRFYDLTACSPKQERSRRECAVAIRYLLGQPFLRKELYRTKKLPVADIVSGAGVSRKTVDRYRKYLIMAVLILDGDFPHLAEYLKYVKEGCSK